MTPEEFKKARENLGLSQADLARVFNISSDRTIRRWEAGEKDIPGIAIAFLMLLTQCPEARAFLGVNAFQGRNRGKAEV